MFEAFLSPDMSYSCAIFPTLNADVPRSEKGERRLANGVIVRGMDNGDYAFNKDSKGIPPPCEEDELYQAQMIKLEHLVKKLKIPEKFGMWRFEICAFIHLNLPPRFW